MYFFHSAVCGPKTLHHSEKSEEVSRIISLENRVLFRSNIVYLCVFVTILASNIMFFGNVTGFTAIDITCLLKAETRKTTMYQYQ